MGAWRSREWEAASQGAYFWQACICAASLIGWPSAATARGAQIGRLLSVDLLTSLTGIFVAGRGMEPGIYGEVTFAWCARTRHSMRAAGKLAPAPCPCASSGTQVTQISERSCCSVGPAPASANPSRPFSQGGSGANPDMEVKQRAAFTQLVCLWPERRASSTRSVKRRGFVHERTCTALLARRRRL